MVAKNVLKKNTVAKTKNTRHVKILTIVLETNE